MKRSDAAPGRRSRAGAPRTITKGAASWRTSAWLRIGFLGALGAAAILVALALLGTQGSGTWVEQGRAGSWTNVTADRLATMLAAKDFTLVDVKTPYIGEIEQTDLYIPYTDLVARAGELPTDRSAKIVVYCRSGNQSKLAAQALLDLGYTNVWNLDEGMESWLASGRTVVQKSRT